MAKKYNLSSKSDMRKLQRDLEKTAIDMVKKSKIPIECPHCGKKISIYAGESKCPECGNLINLSVEEK